MRDPSVNNVCTVYASDDVFLIVAGLAVGEIEGVYSLADYSSGEVLPLGNVKNFSRAIRLEFTEDHVVSVKLSIHILFGYNIPEIAGKIQEKIMNEIFNMIGCHVAFVNIRIADVKLK